MRIDGKFLTIGIGSLPHLDAEKAVRIVRDNFDIPFWPQLPKMSFKEGMYSQYAQGLPSVVIDEKNKKMHVDSSGDLSEGLSAIYEAYLSGDYGGLGMTDDFAAGLYAFLDGMETCDKKYVKGQVTGPVSFGLGVVDENGKSIIYDDTLKDAFIKLLGIKARWQIDRLKTSERDVIIFIDEPYLVSFGSSFFNVEKREIVLMLDAVIDKIHAGGAFAGIHCCGNTDWSILTDTKVDIINFDAYSYLEGLLLCSGDIAGFLKRGGYLAWGIVPTSEAALKETPASLFKRLSEGMERLAAKSIPRDLIISNSMLTPSCGMGTLSEALAEDIISKLGKVAKLAREKF
ncbi:MAG: methionine synthase [Candidatus Omnitrophota bacterium]